MANEKANGEDAVTIDDFADALVAARQAAGLNQTQLADAVGRSTRTLIRWENGDAMPREFVRAPLITWLRTVPGEDAERALMALGVLFPPPPAQGPKALSADQARDAKAALDRALHAAAEKHDVPAGRARAIVAAVLESIDASGVDARDARRLLAPP